MRPKTKSGFETLAKASVYTQEQLMKVKKDNRTFFIGLPKEISLQENRICLTPDAVALLTSHGHEVFVETKAGVGSKFEDKQYSEAGAKIVYSPAEVYKADIILKIEPPTLDEMAHFKPGQTLISALQLGHLEKDFIDALIQKRIISL